MLNVLAVTTQCQNRATQAFRLLFHQKHKARQDFEQRFVRRDHLENMTLPGPENLLFLHGRDVATNDHST